MLAKILLDGQSVRSHLIHYPRLTLRALQKRAQRLVRAMVAQPRKYPSLKGPHILIADGLYYRFGGEEWILFLFLLKPRGKDYAYLLDPLIMPGKESFRNWHAALETIPQDARKRIIAFVSDNFTASDMVAKHYGWLHQLCHFHIIAELQRRRGGRKKTIEGRSIREGIYQTVLQLLYVEEQSRLQRLTKHLRALESNPHCPRKVDMIARGFLKDIGKYRAYRDYPELAIPQTSSAAESLIKLVKKRTRHLRTPQAVQEWATALVRLKRVMRCNGQKPSKIQQN